LHSIKNETRDGRTGDVKILGHSKANS
jgi:hypothetical protein